MDRFIFEKDVSANIKKYYTLSVQATNIAGTGSAATLNVHIVDILGTPVNDTIV